MDGKEVIAKMAVQLVMDELVELEGKPFDVQMLADGASLLADSAIGIIEIQVYDIARARGMDLEPLQEMSNRARTDIEDRIDAYFDELQDHCRKIFSP